MAYATMVWSRAARNIPIIRPTRIVRICRWVSGPEGRSGLVAASDRPEREPAAVVSAEMSALMRELLGGGLEGGWGGHGGDGGAWCGQARLEALEVLAQAGQLPLKPPA